MKAILTLALVLLVSACTRPAIVPPVSVDTPYGETPVAGRYAAMIQTGGWDLQTKSQTGSCWPWTFDTDVNSSYVGAMRDALSRSLEKVDFTADILSPQDLKQKGYDAQIVIQQGNAESDFSLHQRFFSFSSTARARVTLTVIFVIRDENGVAYQNSATGNGTGSKDVYGCPSIGQAVGASAQDAIRSIVRSVVLSLRNGLHSRQIATKP